MEKSTKNPNLTPEQQRELQELLDMLQQLDQIAKSQRAVLFQPVGRQKEVAEALNSGANVVLVMGGNRSGKSTIGVLEAIAHAYGERVWLPKDHPHRVVRLTNGQPIPVPNVGRVLAQSFQQAINQTIVPKFEEWLPAGSYKYRRDTRGIPVEIRLDNGSIIHLMSNDQDDMAFEGPNGHWVWVDEPCDYKKYVGLKRGLVDFSGHMWMTMTPLTQPWIYDTIYARGNSPGSGVRVIHLSIWDNCIDNGGVLRREDIESFLADLTEQEYEARAHGKFPHLAGRVFKDWEPEPPYWIEPFEIPDSWPRVCVIDPHPRKPVAVLWAAIAPGDVVYVYRTLWDKSLKTVHEVASRIKELEGWEYDRTTNQWYPTAETEHISVRLMDSSSTQNERTSGKSVHTLFAEEGIFCRLAPKANAQAGYDAIHEALRRKYEWSQPGLVVFNTCEPLKQNFLRFCWDEWGSTKQRELLGDKQTVRKVDDDFIDCVRYIYQTYITYEGLRTSSGDDEAARVKEIRDSYLRGSTSVIHLGGKQWRTSSKPGLRRASSWTKTPGRSSISFSIPARSRRHT